MMVCPRGRFVPREQADEAWIDAPIRRVRWRRDARRSPQHGFCVATRRIARTPGRSRAAAACATACHSSHIHGVPTATPPASQPAPAMAGAGAWLAPPHGRHSPARRPSPPQIIPALRPPPPPPPPTLQGRQPGLQHIGAPHARHHAGGAGPRTGRQVSRPPSCPPPLDRRRPACPSHLHPSFSRAAASAQGAGRGLWLRLRCSVRGLPGAHPPPPKLRRRCSMRLHCATAAHSLLLRLVRHTVRHTAPSGSCVTPPPAVHTLSSHAPSPPHAPRLQVGKAGAVAAVDVKECCVDLTSANISALRQDSPQ
jgi:hypothetical protein